MIVKNLMAVGIIASVASVASAADEARTMWGIKGKVRMDAVQSSTETKNGDADKTTAKSSEIKLHTADLKLIGDKGGDTMTLKVKLNKLTPNDFLDTATIKHKLTDTVSATFGKMAVLAQSWETDYSSTDQYLYSLAGTMTPDNSTGVQVDAAFGDHNISLQAVNGVESVSGTDATGAATTETYTKSGSLTAALQYRGEINKMIRPMVTYTSVKTSGTKTTASSTTAANRGNGYQTQMGLGVQVDVAGLVADVEYDTVKVHKLKIEGTDPTNKDSDVSSMIVQAKYAIGATSPFLKITSNASKLGQENGVGDVTGMGMALGVEHKLDDNCRLHAVYLNDATSEKAAGSKTNKETMTGFNFGVTAAM